MNPRNQLSPLDGRYADICKKLTDVFSERALVEMRIKIETEYLLALLKLPEIATKWENEMQLRDVLATVSVDRIFEIEKTTRHDVKAVEIAMREAIEQHLGHLPDYKRLSSLIHFGITSQDINSAAVTLQVKQAISTIIIPSVTTIIKALRCFSVEYKNLLMLSHTHGQPATPTTLGKEMQV